MNYLYNGVDLPEPPLGFTGHLLLHYNSESAVYILCYGTFYSAHAHNDPIVSPIANIPTCYMIREGQAQWTNATIQSEGDGSWTGICEAQKYVWTNKDIYWLDETLSEPTAEVAYQGTAAVLVPDDPEPEPEPAKDSRSVPMMMGYLVGQAIRK